jgi:hypothetical protein
MHPRDHVTIMQGVVPVASGLSHMRYELPLHIVRDETPTGVLSNVLPPKDRSEL